MNLTEIVNDTGCKHSVTPEQLPIFLEAGWTIVHPEPKEEPKEKPKKKK